MKNLCIIPATAGSKEVPAKNTRLLNGAPLLEYTFHQALMAEKLDKIIISTDDPAAARAAYAFNIDVPFLTPKHLTQDDSSIYDVVLHAINFFEQKGETFDNVCLLQPACPFRHDGFIDRCIEHFIASNADCLCSVTKVPAQYNPHFVFEADENGYLKVSRGEQIIPPARQLLPPAFARDGSVFVCKTEVIKTTGTLYGNKIAYLETNNQWHIEIETKDDWYKAEMIANVLCSVN